MANVRDSDTSLWLHNKLGTSNDSWISGSICSQLNKEVLRNIKECFPDLQTQVKLKLLLSFFHIPRRLVEEWKTELEEVIEVAGLDSELWVSMLAETMKTYPSTGSLNTEISEYEENRPIFTDMVNELRRLVSKHSDLGMLPLECQYLNKNALISVVGQQPNPVKHFTLKRKPKSFNLRSELLQKSADAQSSLKKSSAPTIPLRSRGMPRKMTDTTPLKGIPSRVPTTGFRSPTVLQNQTRPNVSRTPAGRKDGGIKLIELSEQPLGYAAAKKRKRQQDLEEQQKRALEQKAAVISSPPTIPTITSTIASTTTSSNTPEYTPTITYSQPSTPAPIITTIKDETSEIKPITPVSISSQNSITEPTIISPTIVQPQLTIDKATSPSLTDTTEFIKEEIIELNADAQQQILKQIKNETSKPLLQQLQVTHAIQQPKYITSTPLTQIKIEKIERKSAIKSTTPVKTITSLTNQLANLPNNISVKITPSPKITQVGKQQMKPILINSSTPVILSPPLQQIQKQQTIISNSNQTNHTMSIKTIPNQLKSPTGGPVIISQTIIQPAKRKQTIQSIVSSTPGISNNASKIQTTAVASNNQQRQIILTSSPQAVVPLTSFAQARIGHTMIQSTTATGSTQTPTKILLKTTPTLPVMMSTAQRQQSTNQQQSSGVLNIQNVSLPNRAVTIQPASQAAQQQHIQAQLQQHQQQQQQQQQTHTVVSNTNATQQPKLTQVLMQTQGGNKSKTIYLPQKGLFLRNIGGDMYQPISMNNVQNLQNIGGTAYVTNSQSQTIQVQQKQQIPALIPNNNLAQNINVASLPVVIQQQPQQQTVQTILGNQQQQQQTIIRPVITNSHGSITNLPQGLTLIQRPGQQPQLVQVQTSNAAQQQGGQTQQIQRTLITQPQTQNQRPQQIIIQQKPQTIITQQQQVRPQQPQQQQQQQIIQIRQRPQQQNPVQPQRKGLTLSHEHMTKAQELFKKANRITRIDKALILGFMSGNRENPRPNVENVIVILLGDKEEKVVQEDGSYALCLVESLIRLDYNTGEWKTFQNYRRLDQPSQEQNSDGNIQTQNSVII